MLEVLNIRIHSDGLTSQGCWSNAYSKYGVRLGATNVDRHTGGSDATGQLNGPVTRKARFLKPHNVGGIAMTRRPRDLIVAERLSITWCENLESQDSQDWGGITMAITPWDHVLAEGGLADFRVRVLGGAGFGWHLKRSDSSGLYWRLAASRRRRLHQHRRPGHPGLRSLIL